jgi:hypothetical protein
VPKTEAEINERLAKVGGWRLVAPLSTFAESFIDEMRANDRWLFGGSLTLDASREAMNSSEEDQLKLA